MRLGKVRKILVFMNIVRLIPLLFSLGLSACATSTTRSTHLGEPVGLGLDCHGLAGTYSNAVTYATSENRAEKDSKHTLEMLFENMADPDVKLSIPQFVTISFPEKGMLKVDKINPQGEISDSRTLRVSKGEFTCSNGELTTRTGFESEGGAGGPFIVAGVGNETRTFSLTTKKYLQVKVTQGGAGVIVFVVLPIPVAVAASDYYYFAPSGAVPLQPKDSLSQIEEPLVSISFEGLLDEMLLEQAISAVPGFPRHNFDQFKAAQSDFTVAILMDIKSGEYDLGRGFMQLMTLGLVDPCTATEFSLNVQVRDRNGRNIRSYALAESAKMGGDANCQPEPGVMQKKKSDLLINLFNQIMRDGVFTRPSGAANQ
jgi:hypothetical protein